MLVRVKSVAEAVKLLKRGELVCYPTETAYALGADALNKKACRRIYEAKGRPLMKALPVVVADLKMSEKFFRFSKEASQIAKIFWPGPLTLILIPRRPRELTHLNHLGASIGVRVSSHPTARALSRSLGRPIVATSANKSGEPSAYSRRALQHFAKAVSQNVYLVDGGTLPRRKASTVLDVRQYPPRLIRQGVIKPRLLYS